MGDLARFACISLFSLASLASLAALAGCGGVSHADDLGTDGATGGDGGLVDSGGDDLGDVDLGGATDLGTADLGTDAGPPEPCTTPGATEMVACGRCGSQTRFCTTARVWEYAACMGEHGECVPGTASMQPCGMCGTQAVTCNTACMYVTFGACGGEHGACVAGQNELTTTGCPAGQLHRRSCDDTCAWTPYTACAAIPTDLDGDGATSDVDCDDTDPRIHPGATRPCGSFFCGMFGGSRGTQLCNGPDWGTCDRPAGCADPTGSCTAMQMETRWCPEARWHCAAHDVQTRTCTALTWPAAWSGTCPATTPAPSPPAACATTPVAAACGVCGEGTSYTACDATCMPHAGPCVGTGCTPGAHTRDTTGCPAGEYHDLVCTASCTSGAPSACMSFVPQVDVMLLVDNTGSHTTLVRNSATTLATDLVARLEADMDVQVGVSTFADYNAGGHGGMGDVPFIGQLAPTHDSAMVTAALGAIPSMGGSDWPESHIEGLHDLADGTPHPMAMPFTCPAGTVGGGCWRPGAQRVVVIVTDAPGHSMPDGAGGFTDPYGPEVTPAAPTWDVVRSELIATGTMVFYILPDSSFDPSFDPNPQARAVVSSLGEDPAVAISTYPAGSMSCMAATVDLAPKLAAYVGVMLGP